MHHSQFILEAAKILNERQQEYGDANLCFERIAVIASTLLNMPITRYQIAQIHIATKLARSVESPLKQDTWVDIINYAAFAGNFAGDLQDIETASASAPSPASATTEVKMPRVSDSVFAGLTPKPDAV
jgi:hypothetical protein